MKRMNVLPALLVVAGLGLYGCAGSAPTDPAASGSSAANEPGDQSDADSSETDTIKAELAKLSPEDAAAAEKQRVCPVSGEMLGTMGVPQKVDVDGQQVWICCEGCKDPLLEKPAEYLAKLKQE